jgi:HEAT repeat protein
LEDAGLYEWLIKALDSKKKSSLIVVTMLAAHWPDTMVQAKLLLLVGGKHKLVQYTAMESLARMKEPAFFPIIVCELERKNIFSYLLMSDFFQAFGPDIAQELVTILKAGSGSQHMIKSVLMALENIGEAHSILEAVIPFCTHEEDEIRMFAFQALAKAGVSIPQDLLVRGAQDRHWRVRQFLADCAGHTSPLPVDILMGLLKDENWLVGLHAAQSLCSAGGKGRKLLHVLSQHCTITGQRARMILAEGRE